MIGKLISSVFGVDDIARGAVTAAEGIGNVIDKFVETDDEKRAAEMIKQKMMMRPSEAQIELNKVEARHRSVWVAGWRPAIGWVCAGSLAAYYIPQFVLASYIWVIQCIERDNIVPYPSDAEGLLELVLALLGLGVLRTAEKMAGKTN